MSTTATTTTTPPGTSATAAATGNLFARVPEDQLRPVFELLHQEDVMALSATCRAARLSVLSVVAQNLHIPRSTMLPPFKPAVDPTSCFSSVDEITLDLSPPPPHPLAFRPDMPSQAAPSNPLPQTPTPTDPLHKFLPDFLTAYGSIFADQITTLKLRLGANAQQHTLALLSDTLATCTKLRNLNLRVASPAEQLVVELGLSGPDLAQHTPGLLPHPLNVEAIIQSPACQHSARKLTWRHAPIECLPRTPRPATLELALQQLASLSSVTLNPVSNNTLPALSHLAHLAHLTHLDLAVQLLWGGGGPAEVRLPDVPTLKDLKVNMGGLRAHAAPTGTSPSPALSIPSTLASLTSLSVFNVYNLPQGSIEPLTTLSALELVHCAVLGSWDGAGPAAGDLGLSLHGLACLTSVRLAACSGVAHEFDALTRLCHLVLEAPSLDTLPARIPSSLTHVRVSSPDSPECTVPPAWLLCTQLKTLDLDVPLLWKEVAGLLTRLRSLETLQLDSIDDCTDLSCVDVLTQLTHLELAFQPLPTPCWPQLQGAAKLRSLILSSCSDAWPLHTLPGSLTNIHLRLVAPLELTSDMARLLARCSGLQHLSLHAEGMLSGYSHLSVLTRLRHLSLGPLASGCISCFDTLRCTTSLILSAGFDSRSAYLEGEWPTLEKLGRLQRGCVLWTHTLPVVPGLVPNIFARLGAREAERADSGGVARCRFVR